MNKRHMHIVFNILPIEKLCKKPTSMINQISSSLSEAGNSSEKGKTMKPSFAQGYLLILM